MDVIIYPFRREGLKLIHVSKGNPEFSCLQFDLTDNVFIDKWQLYVTDMSGTLSYLFRDEMYSLWNNQNWLNHSNAAPIPNNGTRFLFCVYRFPKPDGSRPWICT